MLPPKVDISRRRAAVSRRWPARGSESATGPRRHEWAACWGSDRRTRLAERAPQSANGRRRCGTVLVGTPRSAMTASRGSLAAKPRSAGCRRAAHAYDPGRCRVPVGVRNRCRCACTAALRRAPVTPAVAHTSASRSANSAPRPAQEECVASVYLTARPIPPAHRVSLPAARPPMPAERAWRHRLCSSTFSSSSAVSTCAPPSVRLLDWPDRRASTCDGAPRKCHKSVSSLCRSTTRLAASISAKWQLSFARASVPPPPLRQVVGPAVRAAGRGAVGGEGYRAVLVPTPKMRTAGASAPAVRTFGVCSG